MNNATRSIDSGERAQQVLNKALEEYNLTAAEYGHYSAEAIIAKLRWQSFKKSMATTSASAPYRYR